MNELPAGEVQAVATLWQRATGTSRDVLDATLRDHWLDRAEAGVATDRARLVLAVIDGLLRERETTQDHGGTERAMEEFLELLATRERPTRGRRLPPGGLPRRSEVRPVSCHGH